MELQVIGSNNAVVELYYRYDMTQFQKSADLQSMVRTIKLTVNSSQF